MTARRFSPTTALLCIVTAGACWGLNAVIAKNAFDRGVAPARLAEARVVVALAILIVLVGWRRPDLLRPPPASFPALIAFGLSVALVNGAYYVAIDRLPVGVAISLQYTGPVLLLGFAALTAGRKPGRAAWVAAALTLAGATLVSRAYSGLEGLDGVGMLAAVASAFTFASYLLTADLAGRRGAHPATVLVWGFLVAILAWAVLAPWWSWPYARLAEPKVALAVLGVGTLGTLIPFFLAVAAVPILSPATAGIAATVEPPFAAAFAWLFLGQHLGMVQVAGGLLVVGGVILAARSRVLRGETIAVEVAP